MKAMPVVEIVEVGSEPLFARLGQPENLKRFASARLWLGEREDALIELVNSPPASGFPVSHFPSPRPRTPGSQAATRLQKRQRWSN